MDVRTTTVWVGQHELVANVFGSGSPTVVIEPALGGDAEAWRWLAEVLAEQTQVVTYDRAPYGASSAARDARTPQDVARDLDGVLRGLGIRGPLVLVGHSLGGVYIRAYAAVHGDSVAGMVLVDSSHEDQRRAMRGKTPWKWRLMDALVIPSIIAEPRDRRRGGDRRSLIREFRSFRRLTAADRMLTPGALGEKPLIVLTRAQDHESASSGFWPVWRDLQADLLRLSSNSRHIIARTPDHYLHVADPDGVLCAMTDVVRSARTGKPLSGAAAAAAAPDRLVAAASAVSRAGGVRDDCGDRGDHQSDR
ncbi:MAG TPA: alpha/beta hydrolase [Trebonia sp.]|jgi:pimeloyl-ACP methyl ester carboxylesterase